MAGEKTDLSPDVFFENPVAILRAFGERENKRRASEMGWVKMFLRWRRWQRCLAEINKEWK